MDVDAVLRALKAVFLSAVTCLLLPIYPCFIVKFAAEKAADERRAEGLMQPIVGLTLAETEGTDRTGGRGGGGGGRRRRRRKRRRLSITPSILEEGHSGHCEEEQPSLKQPHQGQVPVAQAAGSQISSSPVVLPIASIPTAVRHQIQISISISIYIHHQSPFFTRLPLEIRLAIYHHALACHRVHLVRVSGKVASCACPEGVEPGFSCFVGGRADYACLAASFRRPVVAYGPGSSSVAVPYELEAAPVVFADGATRGIVGALDLLSVCRRVKQKHNTTQQNSYTEAITVLYRHLTFQMDLITLLALSISIPNHHLRAITKLEISRPPLNYIDSCYHLQYLPSFRRIRRPSSTNSSSSSSSSVLFPFPLPFSLPFPLPRNPATHPLQNQPQTHLLHPLPRRGHPDLHAPRPHSLGRGLHAPPPAPAGPARAARLAQAATDHPAPRPAPRPALRRLRRLRTGAAPARL
ncbi:predicted protein [Histoplasma mississippiense (nom. inval.)]|uniref:predicted protein n=1 Tax=Ajellomyces capsulatus (strain NAm1 / WU24) TaxID=2059318 RepID=UPI000157C7F2|nr:predicted protein [Histoplasma mississippiense (nom. inval.)]EDN09811.1 predicted protein [Histoplasma mississippiense (nom. inval.)]